MFYLAVNTGDLPIPGTAPQFTVNPKEPREKNNCGTYECPQQQPQHLQQHHVSRKLGKAISTIIPVSFSLLPLVEASEVFCFHCPAISVFKNLLSRSVPIRFHNADVKFSLKEKKKIAAFLHHQIIKLSNRHVDISFIFCSDEYLLALNKKFLNHDYYTDIITFPLEVNEHSLVSEIYISAERVEENAKKFGEQKAKGKRQKQKGKEQSDSPCRELGGEFLRVMFHGVLHLLGYKDKTNAEQKEMRRMEEIWLKKYEDFRG